jgi:type I restriction enzyme S subunit
MGRIVSILKSLDDKIEVNRKICYGIVQPGFSPKNGIPVIKVNNVVKGLRDVSECDKTTEEISNSYKRTILKGGELIISLVGTVGCVDIAPSSFAGANLVRATGMIDIEDELIKHWVLYYIRTRQGQQYIEENLNTTVQRALNIKDLCKMPIPITSKHYMGRIVSILKSLDDKIEVNRKINENLEQQAQALFKSWFVDFEPFKNGEFVESELGMIPKGWRVEVLGDVCKCILGGTPSRNKEEYWNGNIAWINSGEVNEFRIVKPSEYITEEGLKHSATKLLPKKTTVLAITGATLGQVSLLEIDSCANQSVIGVLENDNIPYVFIYPLINVKITELCSHMTGGAQQHINKNNVEQLNIVLPSENVMAEYKEKTKSIYSQITNCCFESRLLAEIRDTLLPKLMSGELRVSDTDLINEMLEKGIR